MGPLIRPAITDTLVMKFLPPKLHSVLNQDFDILYYPWHDNLETDKVYQEAKRRADICDGKIELYKEPYQS